MGLVYLKDVATLNLDQEKCTGCGICLEVCPQGVLAINGKEAAINDLDLCIECGACAINCPFNAISVTSGVGCAKALMKSRKGDAQPCCGESSGSKGC